MPNASLISTVITGCSRRVLAPTKMTNSFPYTDHFMLHENDQLVPIVCREVHHSACKQLPPMYYIIAYSFYTLTVHLICKSFSLQMFIFSSSACSVSVSPRVQILPSLNALIAQQQHALCCLRLHLTLIAKQFRKAGIGWYHKVYPSGRTFIIICCAFWL